MQSSSNSIPSLQLDLPGITVADVTVMIDASDLAPTYTYRIPAALLGQVSVGCCVLVPFGGKDAIGYAMLVRELPSNDPLAARLKEIEAIVAGAVTFNAEQAEIARFVADRYVCDLSDSVRCIAPAIMGSQIDRIVRMTESGRGAASVVGANSQSHVLEVIRSLGGEVDLSTLKRKARINGLNAAVSALIRKGLLEEETGVSRPQTVTRTVRAYSSGVISNGDPTKLSPQGRKIMEALAEFERRGETPVPPERLLQAAHAGTSALKTLVESGLVVRHDVPVRRAPIAIAAQRTTPPILSPGQRNAADRLGRAIRAGKHRSALLFGVTASGKTEVYLDAIEHTLSTDRTAIVLVPEIALTTQLVSIFTGRFGDEVAVLHSRLSAGERHDEWRRLQEGRARIAVGARSAVFAPVANVGLIVVDEEHEASYKQESAPRYLTRDVAAERARTDSSILVLGSATPSVETFFASEQGQIARLDMPHRIDSRPLPSVEIVDMREEFKERRALFSLRLEEEVGARLARGQQIILFLNRRGYSQFVLCRDCGYVVRCPHCAVSLAFHAAWGSLKCHHCGYSRRVPVACPECTGSRIKGFGIGTERVEEEVLRLFPEARIARMDRDTTSRKGTHQAILDRFRSGDADMLIGTQMVAKGLDFPNVTLVGVVSADTSINMPDFRAAERTFQLLTQVAGRAGRGAQPGNVVIQTFTPDHYAVQAAPSQDYPAFYNQEIQFRKELSYPPFRRFANVVASDPDQSAARGRAEAFAAAMRLTAAEEVEILGPAPAALSRLKDSYRWHVEVRAPLDAPLWTQIRSAQNRLTSAERSGIVVDVDALNMA